MQRVRSLPLTILLASMALAAPARAQGISGEVRGGTVPIAGAAVTLWAAGAGNPVSLATARTGADGRFSLRYAPRKDAVMYVVALGGVPRGQSGSNPAIALVALLGPRPPARVIINEFSTIASAWTGAQFLNAGAFQGSPLGLKIAASSVPNFVDLATGGYGVAIQDPLNSSQTPTMANFATLASVLAGCVTRVTPDACAQVMAAATGPDGVPPTNTLLAAESVARHQWHDPQRLFALLDVLYPVAKGKLLRPTPFLPYLSVAPSAWVLPLKFTGGGYSGGGKLMFDSRGNVWVGDNFLVGAQNVSTLWSGNLTKFAPNGQPLSPATFGFTGGGLIGVGFGLAIDARDNVWPDAYAGRAITKFDSSGKALSPPDGWTFGGRLGEMQGIIVTPNGDIWAVDQGKSQVVHLPGGDPARGRIYCENSSKNPLDNPCGLFAPFHLAIDQQDRIWITNNIGHHVTRFPATDPARVEKFDVGYGGSGMAIDSRGNVWVANRFGSSEKAKAKLAEMMVAYAARGEKAATEVLVHNLSAQKAGFEDGGSVSVLRPDGTEHSFSPVTGSGLAGPWAVAVDGNDNVWVSNLVSDVTGVVELCGVRVAGCRPGAKAGDAISPPLGYVGGGMQQLVDIGVGPSGDVWVTNNWDVDAAAFGKAPEALSTRAAGQGVVVFYGVAKPVKTPQIGPAQPQ